VAPRVWAPTLSVGLPALALTAVTLLAAALRFHSLEGVPPNPFYDAAVRSMALSWHNFFYAAFEPSGRVAVDKPPVDLWLQVASVKVLGFNSLALKLPEALAGTAAVPLLYDLVRRMFGRGAGLASALALAVLPVTVLTSRSDTMDTVMMLCLIAAAWLVVRCAQTGRARFLYLAAVVMGIAFNVKLIEALLPLPALALLYFLASPTPRRKRGMHAFAATLVFLAVALSWVTAVSLAPSSSKPYPLGSTNGSVWNAVFVFNGADRLGLTNRHPGPASVGTPPSATRLIRRTPPPLARWVGSELVPAIVLGGLALLLIARKWRARPPGDRVRVAFGLALAVWLACGIVAFSRVAQFHVRYLEAFTPAIAAALGIGVAVLLRRSAASRRVGGLLAAGVVAVGVYGFYIAKGTPTLEAIVAIAAVCSLIAIAALSLFGRRDGARPLVAAAAVPTLVLALAVPTWASVDIANKHTTAAAVGLRLSPHQTKLLDRYLTAHQGGARYEVAALNMWQAGPLVTAAARPVLVLRNVNFNPLVSPAELGAVVRAGDLRFVLLGPQCGGSVNDRHFRHRCPPAVRWARAHGRVVLVRGQNLGLYRVHA
jgi:4-amino-4-deoxy-L-arabinose transferase-like glycosyltransferase